MKVNEEGLYQCFCRIQTEHPIFIPKELPVAEKLVEEAHILTKHGRVTLTMDKISFEVRADKMEVNLSRPPWWARQFKRIVDSVEQSLFKATKRSKLTKQGLEEIFLYIETLWNNRTDKILQK